MLFGNGFVLQLQVGVCVCVFRWTCIYGIQGKSVCSSSFEFYGFDYLEFDFMGKIGLLLVQILLV